MPPFPPIEIRYLHYFVTLAEELNFQKAAKRLHVTGPALSMQIKKLEDILEVRLCERSSFKKMRLTPAGMKLLSEARDLLRDTQRLVDRVRDAATEDKDSLRIGISMFFRRSFIMEAIKAYRSLYPDKKVDWVTVGDMEHELPEALESGHVHMGFAYDFQLRRMKHVEHQLVVDSPVRAVMGARHPLAAMKEAPLSALADQTLLCLRNSWFDFQDPAALFDKGRPQNIKKMPDCDIGIIADIQGVTLLAETQAAMLPSDMVYRPISGLGSNARMRLHAVWKSGGATPQTGNFLKLLKKFGERNSTSKS